MSRMFGLFVTIFTSSTGTLVGICGSPGTMTAGRTAADEANEPAVEGAQVDLAVRGKGWEGPARHPMVRAGLALPALRRHLPAPSVSPATTRRCMKAKTRTSGSTPRIAAGNSSVGSTV